MNPPEMINAGELVLKRWEPEWAEASTAAILESLPELKPFLPWAKDGYTVEDSREFIARSSKEWDEGTLFNYAIFSAAGETNGELLGAIGLMTRKGPGVLEIGYWLRTSFAGRGYMTKAVRALTRVALTLAGIERVAIQHDVTNGASAAVAAKAGFIETRRFETDDAVTHVVREYQP